MTDRVALSGSCADCRIALPSDALSCPNCGALVHRAELHALSAGARAHAESGDSAAERAALERMLALLPEIAPQARQLRLRLSELTAAARTETGRGEASSPRVRGPLTLLSALGFALWKIKSLGLLLLGKGKLLLVGLTKAKTVFSMLIALGAYWTIWGWQFALGFILSIYVHEMGHVIALRRLGIPASAPMFIPFVGAFVRLNRGPDTVQEDAIVGLAGPIYGLGAAVFCFVLYQLTSFSLLGALARTGAWLNLFNLIPIWQLDGGRAFNALDKQQRWLSVAVIFGSWLWFHESMLLLVLLGALYRVLLTVAPPAPDRRAVWSYGLLVVGLAVLTQVQLPELAGHEAFGP